MEVVSHAAEVSMYSAVEEVQSRPHYVDQGERGISSNNIFHNCFY